MLVSLAAGQAIAQHSAHPTHPPMSGQDLCVRVQWGEGFSQSSGEAPIEISSSMAEAVLNQKIEPTGAPSAVKLVQYLPHAKLEQSVVAAEGEGTRATVELSIEGPTQSFRRWLMANDPERNRLTSFIGTWRFVTAADAKEREELFRQFETEFTREPELFISKLDGRSARMMPVQDGRTASFADLGCTVKVLKFYPHYAMDREKDEAVNRSSKRQNPAVLVEVTVDDHSDQRWVFAKFPDYGLKDARPLPVRLRLDCPAQGEGNAPDFVLVSTAGTELEAWIRHEDRISKKVLSDREALAIPGSQYSFQITNSIPSGRLVEEYRATAPGKGAAALKIEVLDRSGTPSHAWLSLGESKTFNTPQGAMMVSFATKSKGIHGGHP